MPNCEPAGPACNDRDKVLMLRDAPALFLSKCHLKTYLFKRMYGGN